MEKKSNPHNTAQKAAMYVSSISIIVNLLLSLFKLIAGIIARSDAMISDAVHSASDVLSTIVVIVGSKISSKESDTEHPYGHERIECVSSIILSGYASGNWNWNRNCWGEKDYCRQHRMI